MAKSNYTIDPFDPGILPEVVPRNRAVVELGRLGGKVGGKSRSPWKVEAARRNAAIARQAKREKSPIDGWHNGLLFP
jgi:hypothetical protein